MSVDACGLHISGVVKFNERPGNSKCLISHHSGFFGPMVEKGLPKSNRKSLQSSCGGAKTTAREGHKKLGLFFSGS